MDVRKNGHLQRELLRAAVDCCKPGGIIVYSTCSISVEENEAVVDYITKVRHVKIRDTGLPIQKKGLVNYKENRFNPKCSLTRRVYPHVHNMDGFFIAKIQKIKDGEKKIAATNEVSQPVIAKKKKKVDNTKVGNDGLTKKQRNKLASNLKKRAPQTEVEVEVEKEETPVETKPSKKKAPKIPVNKKKLKNTESAKLAKKKKLLLLKKKKLALLRKQKAAEKKSE
jgi:ribosomal RNA methyltransferase Nop2